MQLHISNRSFGQAAVLDCDGRIVFGEETGLLHHAVKDALADNKALVLNLAKVRYIDSSGVGELVGLFTSARKAGARMVLAGLTERVRDVLQITKLAMVFEIYDSVEDAAESFKRKAGKATPAEFAG